MSQRMQAANGCNGVAGSVGTTLRFVVKDCDPTTGLPDSEEGYQDDYIVEDVDIVLGDFVQKVPVN
jgi:coatomer protein complex subunit gamma